MLIVLILYLINLVK